MSAEDKKVIQSITQAVAVLPSDKREYIMGYAEGVIAMTATNPVGQEVRPSENKTQFFERSSNERTANLRASQVWENPDHR